MSVTDPGAAVTPEGGGDTPTPTLRELFRAGAARRAGTDARPAPPAPAAPTPSPAPPSATSLSGVYLVGPDRMAVLPVEQAATMVSAAEFITSQGRGMPEAKTAALTDFAARLKEAMEVARASAVRLDVDEADLGIALFLLTQARARAALSDATRIRHTCPTCGTSTISNPDYEEYLKDKQRKDALFRSGGLAFFTGGITPYLTTSLLMAFRTSTPDHHCPKCFGMKTEPAVVVFCPHCHAVCDRAILKQCPTCELDFLKGIDLGDVWQAPDAPAPAPAGTKLTEFVLDDEPTFIAFDPGGHMLTASQARSVQLWDVSDLEQQPACLWRESAGGIVKVSKPIVAFSPDGRLVATGKPLSRSFKLLRAADGAQIGRYDWAQVDGWGPEGLAFSVDSAMVAVSYDNIDVFAVSPGGLGTAVVRLKAGFMNTFKSIGFSADRSMLAAAGGKWGTTMLFLFATLDWPQLAKVPLHGEIAALAWSPSAPVVAVAVGPQAQLVEAPSGTVTSAFAVDATVTGLAYSPDGALLAVSSEDQSARVFEVSTGAEVTRISRPAPVTAVAFAPDGRLAVGDGANAVQFWSPAAA